MRLMYNTIFEFLQIALTLTIITTILINKGLTYKIYFVLKWLFKS